MINLLRNLSSRALEVSNKISTILWLLQARENHLGTWDVLLRVEEVIEQRLLAPKHTLVLVGVRVCITSCGTRSAAEQATEIWALLMTATLRIRIKKKV